MSSMMQYQILPLPFPLELVKKTLHVLRMFRARGH